MAANADSVVVELIAKNDQFDAAAKASATNYAQSMGTIESAGAGAEKSVKQFSNALKENSTHLGNARAGMMEFQHISRGVADQLAAGASVTQALGQHMAMLGEAVALSGGAFGKLGTFLAGPWGIALTFATTAAIALIGAHNDAKDSADKHRTAEETLTAFINGEKIATDTLLESLKKLDEQESKSLQTTNDTIRARYDLAHATLAQAEANKVVLQTELAAAQGRLAAAQATEQNSIGAPAYAAAAASGAAAVAQAEVNGIQKNLDNLNAAIGHSTAIIDTEFTKLARNLSTHVGRANDEFDRQLAALEAKYRGTEVRKGNKTLLVGGLLNQPGVTDAKRSLYQQQLIDAEEKLGATRAKAVAAAQKLDDTEKGVTRSTEAANRQIGRQINFSDAEAIARGAELTVTSGYRSTAKQAELYRTVRTAANPVAKPGTSAHEGANGKWALDIAFAPGISPASLKKLYGDQGVSLSAVYKETGHYHIEGSRSEAAAVENKAAREAAAAATKAKEQDAAFKSEVDRLNGEFIAARKSQVKGAIEQIAISEEEVRAEEKKRDDGYQSAVTLGKLTQAQANQLIAAEASVAGEKLRALEIQRAVTLLEQADAVAGQTAQFQQDNLKAAEQAATSQQARREIDLQILDILYQEKEEHLKSLQARALANKDQATANLLQGQLNELPQQKANDKAGVLRQTMDPLEAWLKSVPHDAQAVTEALQGIAVGGFENLATSISGVITGTQTLGQAFGNLAKQVVGDLVQMTVRMLIFRALSSALGSKLPGFDASATSSVSVGNVGIASSLSGPSLSSVTASLPHLAGGGVLSVGGNGGTDTNMLSINGQPRAMVDDSETVAIIPNNARAASGGGGGQSIMIVRVVSDDEKFGAFVQSIAGPIAAQAGTRGAYAGAGIARNGLAKRQLHQLGSRG